jgi:DNA-binding NarL/FixJ family response regulator
MNKDKQIIIADDHPLFRIGVKTLIDNLEGFHLSGEANNGKEAIQLLENKTVDAAILDIDMPDQNGIEVAEHIKNQNLNIKIIFLTSHSDLTLFKKAYETYFSGFLFKESALEELEECFNTIFRGETFVSPITKQYLEQNRPRLEHLKNLETLLNNLTDSEKKILLLIIERKTTKEIAETLFNSYKTIENHRLNICHKLNIKGTNNLLSFAINNQEDIKRMLRDTNPTSQ